MTLLLSELQTALSRAVDRLGAAEAALQRTRREAFGVLVKLESSLELRTERRAQQSIEDLQATVLGKVRRGDLKGLSAREGRTAARMLGLLGPLNLYALVTARPELWRTVLQEYFRNWDALEHLPERPQLAGLIASAPRGPRYLDVIDRRVLASKDGPAKFAQWAQSTALPKLVDVLREIDLPYRWGFTRRVISHVAAARVAQHGVRQVFDELATAPEISSCVLPAPGVDGARWFFPNPPATRSGAVEPRAFFIAHALSNIEDLPEQAVTALLESEFGDPRVTSLSRGWELVRHHNERGYSEFLESLVREDLVLFFSHAMCEDTRRNFWLDYLKAIRRTVCVLSSEQYAHLSRILAGGDDKTRAAVARVRKFTAPRAVSAFCLYFDNIVVVEFAETGNAAYVYTRAAFEQIEKRLMQNQLTNEHSLKRTGVERISHFRGWQSKARYGLKLHGVHAAVRPARALRGS